MFNSSTSEKDRAFFERQTERMLTRKGNAELQLFESASWWKPDENA